MDCKPTLMKTWGEIRMIGLWDLLTGIPAGMSTFVTAGVAVAFIGNIQMSSEVFLWILLAAGIAFAVLIGLTRGRHAAPSALIQDLFVFGSAAWLWVNIYPNYWEVLKVAYIFILIIIIPVWVAVKVRDYRVGK